MEKMIVSFVSMAFTHEFLFTNFQNMGGDTDITFIFRYKGMCNTGVEDYTSQSRLNCYPDDGYTIR